MLSRHKPLKISVKFVKTVNQQVISVGFPDTTLQFFSGIFGPFVETGRHTGYFELEDADAGIDLAALREEILHQKPDEASDTPTLSSDLKDQILSFHLAEKTPLEAMMFVRKLQDTIRQQPER